MALIKRVFSKAVGEVNRSIRYTKEMDKALETLANEAGETLNKYITLALDQHLQECATRGEIPWPKDYDPKASTKKSK